MAPRSVSDFADDPGGLHWESHGIGRPVLLIMGLGLSGGAWWRTVPVLSRHFRVITFDNRGVGRSKSLTYSYTTEAMADDAASVLDSAGIASASLYGISLGGMVAQQLALRHPRRADRPDQGRNQPRGGRGDGSGGIPGASSPWCSAPRIRADRGPSPPKPRCSTSSAADRSCHPRKQRGLQCHTTTGPSAGASTRRESPRMWSSGSRIHSQPTPIERSSVPLGSTTVLAACLVYRCRR